MKLLDLATKGHRRARRSIWASPECYLRLPRRKCVGDGLIIYEIWSFLFDRATQQLIGEPTPQELFTPSIDAPEDDWEPYSGPIDPEDREE